MKKKKLTIEYTLKARSESLIWSILSTPEGLSRWLADEVSRSDKALTFTWGELWRHHEVKHATILSVRRNKAFRFRWDDDSDPAAYVELRMSKSELTGDCILSITDFAIEGEEDDMRDLWDDNLDRLHQSTGL